MKAGLFLEAIGDCYIQETRLYQKIFDTALPGIGKMFRSPISRPWVAEITGLSSKYKYERQFLSHTRDYTKANGKGSRGVRFLFLLESGKIYEVYKKTSWKSSCLYFCQVTTEGDIQEIPEEEVKQWLEQTTNACSALPSTKQLSNE